MKVCAKCGDAKPLTAFHRDRALKDGVRTYCKACANAVATRWNHQHRERRKAWEQAHYERHARRRRLEATNPARRAHRKSVDRAWRQQNRARLRAWEKQWSAAHPGHRLASMRASLFKKTRAMLACVTWRDLLPVYEEAARLTVATGIPHQVDHIVPLKHPLVCGLHVPANLQVLSLKENRAKHNQFVPLVISAPHPQLEALPRLAKKER